MRYSHDAFVQFMKDLNAVVLDNTKNKNFRTYCLRLIEQHFDISVASFIIFPLEDNENLENQSRYLNNVTIGMPAHVMKEYYEKYYKYDPFNEIERTTKMVNLTQLIDFTTDESHPFYDDYYKKHGFKYQISAGIINDGRVIGALSLIRRDDEQEFTEREIRFFEDLRDIIAAELRKLLLIKKIMTENYALRDISRTFPVGQIILSQQYDVVYHNDIAAQAFESLAQLDIAQFKYYFINELLEETLFEKVEASAFFEKTIGS